MGSPPLVRGLPLVAWLRWPCNGITPACAGTTTLAFIAVSAKQDHPRLCGDYIDFASLLRSWQGSPPLVRGLLHFQTNSKSSNRITPACAGTTFVRNQASFSAKDHPRLCGDYYGYDMEPAYGRGSPPLVRGLHLLCPQLLAYARITPACAGTTFAL